MNAFCKGITQERLDEDLFSVSLSDYRVYFYFDSDFRPLSPLKNDDFSRPFYLSKASGAAAALSEKVRLLDYFEFGVVNLTWILPFVCLFILIILSSVLRRYVNGFSQHVSFRQLVFLDDGNGERLSLLDFWMVVFLERVARFLVLFGAIVIPLAVIFVTPFVSDPGVFPVDYIGFGSLFLYAKSSDGALWFAVTSVAAYYTIHICFVILFRGGWNGLRILTKFTKFILFVFVLLPLLLLCVGLCFAIYYQIFHASGCYIGGCELFGGVVSSLVIVLFLLLLFLYIFFYTSVLIFGPSLLLVRTLGRVLYLIGVVGLFVIAILTFLGVAARLPQLPY